MASELEKLMQDCQVSVPEVSDHCELSNINQYIRKRIKFGEPDYYFRTDDKLRPFKSGLKLIPFGYNDGNSF
jgi:hypothetical protein